MPRPLEFMLYVLAAGCSLFAWITIDDGDLEVFPYALAGLLALSAAELVRQWRRDRLWLADACVLLTITLFGVSYGVSNLLFLLAPDFLESFSPVAMTKTTLLATLGCFFLWRGYRLPAVRKMADKFAPRRATGFAVASGVCILLFAISLGAVFTQVQLGLFGYSLDRDAATELVGYRYTLTLLTGFGDAVLVTLALSSFGPGASRRSRRWLFVVTTIMVMIGLLSGFKTQVVAPILYVAACYYIRTSRLPRALLAGGAAALIVAYVVIQPFRAARYEETYFDPSSFTSIASAFLAPSEHEFELSLIGLQVISRLNLTSAGASGIAYLEEGHLQDDDPSFALGLLLAPAYAITPRFLWPERPQATIGGWYTRRVLNKPEDTETSTGMGPVTYFNFVGGALGVTVGFFALGMIYRMARALLEPSSGGRLLVYVLMLPTLVWIEAGVMDSILIHLIRTIPIYLALQHFLFVRPRRSVIPVEKMTA